MKKDIYLISKLIYINNPSPKFKANKGKKKQKTIYNKSKK